jgi:hypothetical protein
MAWCDAVAAGDGVSSRFARNDLAGVVKYNRLMRLLLFLLAFACLFCGFDEAAYDFHYTMDGSVFGVVAVYWVVQARYSATIATQGKSNVQ